MSGRQAAGRPGRSTIAVSGRPGRSTVAVSGRPDRSTDVHRTCTLPCWGGRSTARELCSLESLRSTGRRPGREHCSLFPDSVDRPKSRCSLDLARSTGRSTARLNGHFFDRWLVDRPVDRKAKLGLFLCQRADSFGAIYTPFEGCFV